MCALAGADVRHVVRHRSDVIKYSIIGYSIGMTILLGILCGFAAAWYFSKSVVVSLVFGLFWGAVVGCIDRALVVTYKKDPEMRKKPLSSRIAAVAVVILPRAVLAFCVAFVMSIPAELIVFEDFINKELPGYREYLKKENARASYVTEQNSTIDEERQENAANLGYVQEQIAKTNNQISAKSGEVEKLKREIANLKSSLDHPTSGKFRTAETQYNEARTHLRARGLAPSDSMRYVRQRGEAEKMMSVARAEHNAQVRKDIESKNEQLKSLNREVETLGGKMASLETKQEKIQTRGEKILDRIDVVRGTNDSIVATVDTAIAASNRFTLGYAVLQYAVSRKRPVYEERKEIVPLPDGSLNDDGSPRTYEKEYTIKIGDERANPNEFFLLNLIRLMFFVLELVPTIVKVVAPVGGYEYEIASRERAIAEYYESDEFSNDEKKRLKADSLHEAQLEQDRRDLEREMHSRLIKEVAATQEEVAMGVIGQWRRQQLEKAGNAVPPASQRGNSDYLKDEKDLFESHNLNISKS